MQAANANTLELAPPADSSELLHVRHELDLRNCALNAATTHFLVLDARMPGWPIVYCNRALAKDFGYEPAELLGQSAGRALIDREQSGAALRDLNESLLRGGGGRCELVGRRRDGSNFWIGMSVVPVRDADGFITHYVSVGADITVRRADEVAKRALQEQLYNEMRERERIAIELRLAQKLESVGRLAAGVAHEINTPIQYVADSIHFLRTSAQDAKQLNELYRQGFRRLAQGESLEDVMKDIDAGEQVADLEFLRVEIPKAFERTMEGVERVASIVRAMKEFAHPDTNEQQPADINHALETTLTVARNEYKYIASVDVQLGVLPDVKCNIGELNQVFLNLIVNAAHAIQETGKDVAEGRIGISTAVSGNSVIVTIEDNGCGIPQENVDKVFDPFFTTKEVGRGTGQGLAIARSIVIEKHGGSIDLHSELGSGTRFLIELPIEGRTPVEQPL